jgi:2-keto-4-pentenoate hydratase/2-oxohepta-3-ene-1,7-dioic acid hydratase in catechol pathway
MLVCSYADGGRRYGRIEREPAGDLVVPIRYDPQRRRWVPGTGRFRPLPEIELLPPAAPSKIVCIALNHAQGPRPDAGGPLAVVLKPPSSLVGPGAQVDHPGHPWELRHEAELAVVIGVPCRAVPPERAAEVVAGYTCANDVTAYAKPGDPRSSPWAKHFDGLTPLGPWLAVDLDPGSLQIVCRVDGRIRQQGSTSDFIRSIPEVIALVSERMTLTPGDVILTGTPAGSSPLPVGSRVEVSISGIGSLHNVIGRRTGAAAGAIASA